MPNAARIHKTEVIERVQARINDASASIVTEYRGLSVAELAELRDALAAVGGDYKIFKNTLVKRAIDGGEYQPLSEYLSGPTALTFVQGDVSAVAKALRDFAKANPLLVIKGDWPTGRCSRRRISKRSPTCRRATSCWPASPGPWPRRCNSWPACSRRSRATWPTASRP